MLIRRAYKFSYLDLSYNTIGDPKHNLLFYELFPQAGIESGYFNYCSIQYKGMIQSAKYLSPKPELYDETLTLCEDIQRLCFNSATSSERKVNELHVNLMGNACDLYLLETPGIARSKINFRFGIQPNPENR
jgi:hypothetical protein